MVRHSASRAFPALIHTGKQADGSTTMLAPFMRVRSLRSLFSRDGAEISQPLCRAFTTLECEKWPSYAILFVKRSSVLTLHAYYHRGFRGSRSERCRWASRNESSPCA